MSLPASGESNQGSGGPGPGLMNSVAGGKLRNKGNFQVVTRTHMKPRERSQQLGFICLCFNLVNSKT